MTRTLIQGIERQQAGAFTPVGRQPRRAFQPLSEAKALGKALADISGGMHSGETAACALAGSGGMHFCKQFKAVQLRARAAYLSSL